MPATDETTRRLSLRIDRDLKHRVTHEAERRGQSLTVFVERALRATLTTNADPRSTDRAARTLPPIGQDAENERAFRDAAEMRLQSYELPEPQRAPDAKAPRSEPDAGTPLPSIAPRRTP